MESKVDKRLMLNIKREIEIPSRIKRLLTGLISELENVIVKTGHISEARIEVIVVDFIKEVLLLFPHHSVKSFTCEFPATRGATYHLKIALKWGYLSINITPPAFKNGLITHNHSFQELMTIRP